MLGPLLVHDGASWSAIRAGQQRVVAAILLIEAGRAVPVERLVDELWGERPPPSAVATVRGYVMRLRRLLDHGQGGMLVTRGRGYELVVEDGDVDERVFSRLVTSARHALAHGRPEAAAAALAQGLALWRGPALADVPAGPAVTAEAERLEQLRLAAVEDWLGVQLELGRHADVVDEARRLVGEHPLRERLWARLMLALHRGGLRAEALDAYQRARRVLVDELGLEPGAELRALQRAVLAGQPEPPVPARRGPDAAAVRAEVVPAQLPAEAAAFVGRHEALERLDGHLSGQGDRRSPAVVVIAGAAGVGKTALAVHWAHQARERFPDGQLYVDLRGWADGAPLRALDALAGFLPALGMPSAEVPDEVERAAASYRSLLAGKRVLVVLDNARGPGQVRPLLPASPGCAVVLTSRDQLRGLVARDGAVRLDLDVLAPREARTLLTRLLGAERVDGAEEAAVADLARLCGYLPLALRIAAANLSGRPRATVAGYAAELAAGDRLRALETGDDADAAVRVAFDRSYAALPAAARRLFRLLGLVPGADIGPRSAAALAADDTATAAALLDRLARAHLAGEHAPNRYALHDLLRRYAADRAAAEDGPADRDAALGRLLDHYLHGVDAAARLLYPQMVRLPLPPAGDGRPVPGFDDETRASQWLDAERRNLVAAVVHAAEHGPRAAAWRLADAVRGHLFLRASTVDWSLVAGAALAAAERDADPAGQAAAHLSLATLHWVQNRTGQATDHFTTALRLARQARWAEGESAALANLGNVHADLGQLEQAADHYAKALELERRIGRHETRALTLTNAGLLSLALGRLELAADYHRQALDTFRRTGPRSGEATAMLNLGEAYHALGRLDDADALLEQAHTLTLEIGDRYMEGEAVRLRAAVYRDTGRLADALRLARTAVALARDAGDRRNEADALTTRASIHDHLGDHEQAVDGYRRALAVARDAGKRYEETSALLGLAAAHHHAGDHDQAGEHAERALTIARQGGYRLLEADALTTLAAARRGAGDPVRAGDHARQALAIHDRTGHRLGQARARAVLTEIGGPEADADSPAAHRQHTPSR